MLFDLNKKKLMVKFSHSNPCTYAELWAFKDDLGEYDCLNIVGIAECSKKDIFSKVKGRKIALARLFKKMNIFAKEDNNLKYLHNTKKQRTAIWKNVYFKDFRME